MYTCIHPYISTNVYLYIYIDVHIYVCIHVYTYHHPDILHFTFFFCDPHDLRKLLLPIASPTLHPPLCLFAGVEREP